MTTQHIAGPCPICRSTTVSATTHSAAGEQLATAQDQIRNLRTALTTSRRIGMAIGILMKTHAVTEHAAFALLSEQSQNLNRKVRDLAEQILVTGELPVN